MTVIAAAVYEADRFTTISRLGDDGLIGEGKADGGD